MVYCYIAVAFDSFSSDGLLIPSCFLLIRDFQGHVWTLEWEIHSDFLLVMFGLIIRNENRNKNLFFDGNQILLLLRFRVCLEVICF